MESACICTDKTYNEQLTCPDCIEHYHNDNLYCRRELNQKTRMEEKAKFKKGDQVVMHTCHESTMEKYRGKVWTCRTDSYIDKAGQEVVFLKGFSGYFWCKYLALVNQPQWIVVSEQKPTPGTKILIYDRGVDSAWFHEDNRFWNFGEQVYPTHWMPVPSGPGIFPASPEYCV